MLMWLRDRRKDIKEPEEVSVGWVIALLVLVTILVPFGMWIDAHDPEAQAARKSAALMGQYRHETGMALGMLGMVVAALLFRWRTRWGHIIRYTVIWLSLVGLFMVGYHFRHDIKSWFFASTTSQLQRAAVAQRVSPFQEASIASTIRGQKPAKAVGQDHR